jgi:hypothetical protein
MSVQKPPEYLEDGLAGSQQDEQMENKALVGRLVAQAQADGRELVGRDGLVAGC